MTDAADADLLSTTVSPLTIPKEDKGAAAASCGNCGRKGTCQRRADMNVRITGRTLMNGTGLSHEGEVVSDSYLHRFGRKANKQLLESYGNS